MFGAGAGGTWQLDDYNHTKYPIITTNLVSGQRDYSFTTDEQGNIILDIYKVMVADSAGIFHTLTPVDQQGNDAMSSMTNGVNSTGMPTEYDKTGNAIFLNLIPSYSYTNGLKVWINREASYFIASDTTKKWGFTGIYHEYLVLYACYKYAVAKMLSNRDIFKRDLLEMEEKIKKHLGQRQRDVKPRMIPNVENNK